MYIASIHIEEKVYSRSSMKEGKVDSIRVDELENQVKSTKWDQKFKLK